jgi:hypothetical protein
MRGRDISRGLFISFTVILFAALLTSCGGGGGEETGSQANVWVYIDDPVYNGTAPSVSLSGEAYSDIDLPSETYAGYCESSFYQCPSGIPAVDISWLNDSTGAGGAAEHGISGHCSYNIFFKFCGCSCKHVWWASVPLQEGENIIEVTASYSGSTATDSVTVIRDNTPPSVPGNLQATAVSSTQIDLSWSPSTDNVNVMGYKVYRTGILITTLVGDYRNYSDTGLAGSTQYCYTISAYDAAGNQSDQSAPACAITQ